MSGLDLPIGTPTGEVETLSSWAAPYVTNMLGKGQALSNMPFQGYGGPLTAGQSALQTQAFQGLAGLNIPTTAQTTYDPMSFTGAGYAAPTAAQAAAGETGTYTPASGNVLQQYMTPYLQGALQPQYDAANRQALISAQNLQSQFGKAGAYGGSRQGVAEAELQRGLLDRMAGITGTGYQQAFEQAQNQFNAEQQRQMAAAGQAQQYGIQALGAQRLGGAEQRAIEGQGIAAKNLDKIFEPFYTTNHQGSGLGLYIVNQLCELNDASISVKQNLYQGTSFIIECQIAVSTQIDQSAIA